MTMKKEFINSKGKKTQKRHLKSSSSKVESFNGLILQTTDNPYEILSQKELRYFEKPVYI